MKNAMKKLMAFALVAVMLVGALPFHASAVENDSWSVTVSYTYGENTGSITYENITAEQLKKGDVQSDINKQIKDEFKISSIEAADKNNYPFPITEEKADELNGIFHVTVLGTPIVTEDDNDGSDDQEQEVVDTEKTLTVKYNGKTGGQQIFSLEFANGSVVKKDTIWGYIESYVGESVKNINAHEAFPVTMDVDQTIVVDVTYYPAVTEEENNKTDDNNNNNNNKEDETIDPIKLIVIADGETKHQIKFNNTASATVSSLLANYWKSTWDFDYYTINDSEVEKTDLNRTVEAGDTVTVYMETHVSKLNSNKVYLHIFMNNDFDDPVKNINITNGIAADGVVDVNNDVKTVVKEYFTAKDSDGIKYDGLYVSTGDWVGDFLTDTKDEYVDNIKELKEDGYVHLNLMITNAKLKSSSTADSTNPKTGDNIYMTMAVMTLSVSALAVVFFLNKKRAVK